MKKTKLILSAIAFILTALIFVQACKKGNTVDLSGTYELQLNETKSIPTAEGTAKVTVFSIDDSRCPINANCISAGGVIVKAKIIDNRGAQTIELCMGDCAFTTINFKSSITLNGVRYNYALKDVVPFPVYPKDMTIVQKATIILTKA